MRKRITFILMFVLCMVLSLSGCGKKEKPVETEPVTPKVTEKPTETPTPPQTEPQTEKKLSLKDIQVQVPKASRSGSINYQILEGKSITASGSGTFESTSSAFHASNGTDDYYSTSKGAVYHRDGKYSEMEVDFFDIWNSIYDEEVTQKNDVLADNIPCYYLSFDEGDETIGSIIGLCYISGYTDVFCGSTQIDLFVSKESLDIIRLDAHTPFKAVFGESDVNGEIAVSIKCKLNGNVNIVMPEAEKEPEEVVDNYEAGTIFDGQNSYKNKMFDIQLVGKDLFYFDITRTEDVSASYYEINSPYREEAYGSGDGIIVNISSIAKNGATKENVLAKYLMDSGASDIQASGRLTFASSEYACSKAVINDTSTKTYCTDSADRVLLITLYYKDEAAVSAFEECFFGTNDDPFWSPESWILKGIYTVTTPKGYTIAKADSSDMYVCFASSANDVNIFAKSSSSIEAEYNSEITSVGDKTRELISEEDIPLNDGSTMKYIIVHNSEPSYTYYTYIGLAEKNGTIFEYYMVSAADDADYKNIYTEIANAMTVEQQENDNVPEEQPEQP